MSPPLISVVIPAHNREHTIGYCQRSVLGQSYPNFEIIVVDDGSGDNTVNKVGEFDDRRVRLIRHRIARGAQAARNTGIRAAQGQWIAFLNSDDEWSFDKLKIRLRCWHPAIGRKTSWCMAT